MIAAAIGLATRWFGAKRSDSDGDVQGDDPIVRALFKAVNDGEIDDLLELVSDDCRVTLNSRDVSRNDAVVDRGPAIFSDAIGDMRKAFPDVHWELYDELGGKDDGKEKLAVRLVSTLTIDARQEQLEVAAVGIVEDEKLVEWHQVADYESYNRRRMETGESAIGS
jgi:hypothetical protein